MGHAGLSPGDTGWDKQHGPLFRLDSVRNSGPFPRNHEDLTTRTRQKSQPQAHHCQPPARSWRISPRTNWCPSRFAPIDAQWGSEPHDRGHPRPPSCVNRDTKRDARSLQNPALSHTRTTSRPAVPLPPDLGSRFSHLSGRCGRSHTVFCGMTPTGGLARPSRHARETVAFVPLWTATISPSTPKCSRPGGLTCPPRNSSCRRRTPPFV